MVLSGISDSEVGLVPFEMIVIGALIYLNRDISYIFFTLSHRFLVLTDAFSLIDKTCPFGLNRTCRSLPLSVPKPKYF